MRTLTIIVALIIAGCAPQDQPSKPYASSPAKSDFTLEAESYAMLFAEGVKSNANADYTDAIKSLTTALDMKESAEAFTNRGYAYHQIGELKLAIADFNEAVKMAPNDVESLHNRAKWFYDTGDNTNSLTDYDRVIELAPEHGVAYYFRGLTHRRLADYGSAIEDFQNSIGVLLHDNEEVLAANAFNSLAWLVATCPDASFRNGPKAVEVAKAACKVSGDQWNHLDTLAAAYAESGDFAEAVATQTKAIERAPEDQRTAMRKRLKLYEANKAYRQGPE